MVKISLTKTITILLLLLTATPYLYFFIQAAEQKAARKRMEERMEKEIFQTISVRTGDINWAEEGKEAWIGGRMFDIKSFRREADRYILTGLFDEEETALVKDLINQQQKQNAGGNKLIAGFFQLFNYTETSSPENARNNRPCKNSFAEFDDNIISHQPAVLSPPPRS